MTFFKFYTLRLFEKSVDPDPLASSAYHRGSYMSAHVLMILLNVLRKRDKMQGLSSISSLFRNKFNKFNNTRAQI